jgi:hypothetical protein
VDHKSVIDRTPAYVEQVWFAADLAILDVLLAATGGVIHEGLVPLPAPRALVARISHTVLHRGKFSAAFFNGKAALSGASSANVLGIRYPASAMQHNCMQADPGKTQERMILGQTLHAGMQSFGNSRHLP